MTKEEIDNFYKHLLEDEKNRKEQDKAVLSQIKSIVNEDFFKDIIYILEDDTTYNYLICDKPEGKYRLDKSEYPNIKGYWINPIINGGYFGDEYKGTISIKLPNGTFFKFNYES